MTKIITILDDLGNYRVISPAYDWLARAHGFSEDEALNWVWTCIVEMGGYGVSEGDCHIVEDVDQQAKLAQICGQYFRFPCSPSGEQGWSKDGAWEMDTDGTPKLNMAKARGVQMNRIRLVRNAELAKKDVEMLRAIEAGDDSQATVAAAKQRLRDIPQTFDLTAETPDQLKGLWPTELPPQPDSGA